MALRGLLPNPYKREPNDGVHRTFGTAHRHHGSQPSKLRSRGCRGSEVHELDLVHRVRRAHASPRGRTVVLWNISRQAAHRQVTQLRHNARIEGPQACPRGLRHSFGVAAVQAGVPLTTIAAVLGHADVSPTAIYCQAIGAEARELVSRVSGTINKPKGAQNQRSNKQGNNNDEMDTLSSSTGSTRMHRTDKQRKGSDRRNRCQNATELRLGKRLGDHGWN